LSPLALALAVGMDPAVRRKIRNRALLLWAVVVGPFVVLSIPSGPPPSPAAIFLWLVGEVAAALLALPLAFALTYAGYRLRVGRQKRMQPRPSSELAPRGVTPPFRFAGKRWKPSVGVLLFVLIIIVPIWFLPAPNQAIPNAMAQLVRWLGLVLAALAMPAAFLGLREVTYQIDDRGIHVRRAVRRRSFDASWEAISQVESPQLHVFASTLLGSSTSRLKTYGLRTKDGVLRGIVRPSAELGPVLGEAFESSLLGLAAERGVRVVEVSWRATMKWKQGR
jgi:hypothetical protein